MTQIHLELSDHTEDIKTVCVVCFRLEPFNFTVLPQYLTAISDPRGKQCSLADTVYREG